MAKTVTIKPEEQSSREFADRLVLEVLTDLYEVAKPSEIADRLSNRGVGLSAVRSLLASNPDKFAYNDRRWVPASRLETDGRPFAQALLVMVQKFGGQMPVSLAVKELGRRYELEPADAEDRIMRIAKADPNILYVRNGSLISTDKLFVTIDETEERAIAINRISEEDVQAVEKALGKFDWRGPDAIVQALEKSAPVNLKALGAAAWRGMNSSDPKSTLIFEWRTFFSDLLSVPGFVLSPDGQIYPEKEAAKWIQTAVKIADKLTPTIELEDATPIELKPTDVEAMVAKITANNETTRATELLETLFEITPQVKTFPDDLANVQEALAADKRVAWIGGDRYRKPSEVPDFVKEVPLPFEYVNSDLLQEDGDPVDAELNDEGLSSSLRKLIVHPLAMDVLDENIMPQPKGDQETVRCVLRSIHRELGTFPLAQFPTGWLKSEPEIQELLLEDGNGRTLSAWVSMKTRLIQGMFEWFIDQPVESGAVFALTKTAKSNVFEFEWMDQADPVVYISSQRMEELREIASRTEGHSTFDVLREVMAHWSKGADFLTILWEVNVVRRTSRRLLASLLSSYVCFYQRSGSPVWHYDHKKVELGFDKTKKKFILKN